MGLTPFFMVFGLEVILSTELEYDTPRVTGYNKNQSEQAQQSFVDRLDQAWDIVVLRSTKYQQTLWHYHGRKVQPQAF
jgi:hypothetical protein